MKDLSFFLLKNAFGAKMKKKYTKNFCNGDDSTSTANPQNIEQFSTNYCVSSPYKLGNNNNNNNNNNERERDEPSLEEMIVQLELEEKAARRSKMEEYDEIQHRMSCVNSSDILRCARNALNQYPRFSLDGKDAMYRSSFRDPCREFSGKLLKKAPEPERERIKRLPASIAGESVVWCRPGIVAKLMGLEAMPMPVSGCHRRRRRKAIMKEKFLNYKTRFENNDEDIEKIGLKLSRNGGNGTGSCSKTDQYVLKPLWGVEERRHEAVGWPMRRCNHHRTSGQFGVGSSSSNQRLSMTPDK